MTPELLGSGALAPLGADVRQPVIIAFLVFIGCSLLWLVTLVTGQEDGPERLCVAGRSLSPVLNGFALAGEQITAVTLLALPGAIALFGYDGFAAAVDTLLALGVTLLLARRIRDSNCHTLGDVFGLRAPGAAPRIAAALVTLTITLPVLLLQFRAAGIGASLLIGASTEAVQVVCTIMIGGLVVCFAVVAELRGTAFMHVVKVLFTLVTLSAVVLLALRTFGWDPGDLLSAAVNGSIEPDAYLSPGLWPYETDLGPLNDVGAHMVVILGAAVAPHLVLRLNASRTGESARRSATIAVVLTSTFVTLLVTAGFAATAVVASGGIGAVDDNGQSSLILLASEVLDGGSPMRVALITAVSCATFLAVLTGVSSVTFAAAVSLTQDVFARHERRRTDTGEVRTLRLAVVGLCAMGLLLAAATYRYEVEFLITFATSVAAASCVFPALILTSFWKGFNRRGAAVVRLRRTAALRPAHALLAQRLRTPVCPMAGSGLRLVSAPDPRTAGRTGGLPPGLDRQRHLTGKPATQRRGPGTHPPGEKVQRPEAHAPPTVDADVRRNTLPTVPRLLPDAATISQPA
ncbi:transporter [Streptomyces sp. NPDC093088]|uniref:sodium:solute symporter family transporter n=1 Tax=Streptomyces sp. NPDC093088 TaxID=3366023 RepID=UPI00382F5A48